MRTREFQFVNVKVKVGRGATRSNLLRVWTTVNEIVHYNSIACLGSVFKETQRYSY